MRHEPRSRGRRAFVTLLAFVALLAASLRVPSIVPVHPSAPSVSVAPTRSSDAPELAAKPLASCRVPAARPAVRDADVRLLAASNGSGASSCVPLASSEQGAAPARTWTPSAKTRAELMVFLN